MAENKIYPWAQSSNANVFSDAEYAADVEAGGIYVGGVQTGLASSKQANKTWRQATAPGSGLGQFLVDNLSVDVTDADTPATFSSRIANAILKLAQISPFNQSFAAATGGYRKYAIVSDSSGNFWVSTADQNVTVPGSSGAKWQSLFDGYATNADLSTEASSRANADTNLQNQINNRVLKTGDTSTGSQFTRNKYDNGTLHWGPSWTSVIAGMSGGSSNGDYSFGMWAQELDGVYTAGILSLNGFQGRKDFRFNEDGNIITPLGTVALESDISNLQSQVNGKQPAGSYVTADAYSSDFGTSDSRVINLAYGHRIQAFKTGNVTNGDIVTFPTSFSSTPSAIICQGSRGDWDVWAKDGTWTTTGFTIDGASQNGGAQPLTVIAIGPK